MTAQVEYPAGQDPHRGRCHWDGVYAKGLGLFDADTVSWVI